MEELMFMLLLVVHLSNVTSITWNVSKCPLNCQCVNSTLDCNGATLPDFIPNNITNVYLRSLNLENLKSEPFKSETWRNVKLLDINSNLGEQINFFRPLKGLDNLEHFGLHSTVLKEVNRSIFWDVPNVLTLDLSENRKLFLLKLLEAFKISDITGNKTMPALKNISLANIQKYYSDVGAQLDKGFFEALTQGRSSIKYVDLSDMNIELLDYAGLILLCNSVEFLKAQRISAARLTGLKPYMTCKSLKTFDVSGANLPYLFNRPGGRNETFNFHCIFLYFFYGLENLYVNSLFQDHLNTFGTYLLDFSTCPFELQRIQLRRNSFKQINTTVALNQSTQQSLRELDFSENILEYIAPETIQPSKSLETINLSNNRLYLMQKNFPQNFVRLFGFMPNIQWLNLSSNQLTNLIENVFQNNSKLQYLDLSNNHLTSVTFTIDQMTELKLLNLSGNRINEIQPHIRNVLDHLYNLGDKLKVDLSSNDLHCLCDKDNIESILWIKTSAVIYRQQTTYFCILDGNTVDIAKSAIEETQQYCQKQKIIHIIEITLPCIAGAIILLTIIGISANWQYRRKRNFRNTLQQIQNNHFCNKLVFLSFCSDDGDLALDTIYPQLNQELNKITKTENRQYVSSGEHHFRPGFTIHNEAMRCIEESAVIIFVVSNIFCQKKWCQMELREAYAQHKPMILMMTEKVNLNKMPKFLRKIFNRYTHASWVKNDTGGHPYPDWPELCESIIHLASGHQ